MVEIIGNIIGALVIVFMIAMVICAFCGIWGLCEEYFKDDD